MEQDSGDDTQILLAVGLVATCTLSLVALWRLVVVVIEVSRMGLWRRVMPDILYTDIPDTSYASSTVSSATSVPIATVYESETVLPQRAMFHLLVFLCVAVEVPVYAYHYLIILGSSISFEVGRDLYAVHLISYLLLFAAFCIIVGLWSSVAVYEPTTWVLVVNRTLLVLCVAYSGVTVTAVWRCLCEESSSRSFFTSLPFTVFCSFSVGALLLLAACFLGLGCMMQQRICTALAGEERCTGSFASTVLRLNVVVLTCFVCFSLRAFLLLQLLELENGEVGVLGWEKWQQGVYIEWIPNVIPCAALLYLFRRTGMQSVDSKGSDNGIGIDHRNADEETALRLTSKTINASSKQNGGS